ncbi:MAG: beta-lactamase domain-containing protein [Methylocystaceae bacterium]|nr:MAG: beta-lactamase domain-containing protein [Methylocystaceae bacterium]
MRPLGRDEGAVIQAGTHTAVSARVSALTRRALAPNPGPFTYTGTCSYLVGNGDVAIIDPGPDDPRHIEALLASISGETLRYVLVTHTHRDHSPAARALKEATGAIIAGCAPYLPSEAGRLGSPNLDAAHDRTYAPDIVLRDGDTLEIGDASLVALATPGHTANHLCFALAKEQALFTGDHVMAWATTVIAPPDGSMGAYMASGRGTANRCTIPSVFCAPCFITGARARPLFFSVSNLGTKRSVRSSPTFTKASTNVSTSRRR